MLRAPEVEEAPIHARFYSWRFGNRRIDWEGVVGQAEGFDRFGLDLDTTKPDARIPRDQAFNSYGRFSSQGRNLFGQAGTGLCVNDVLHVS